MTCFVELQTKQVLMLIILNYSEKPLSFFVGSCFCVGFSAFGFLPGLLLLAGTTRKPLSTTFTI